MKFQRYTSQTRQYFSGQVILGWPQAPSANHHISPPRGDFKHLPIIFRVITNGRPKSRGYSKPRKGTGKPRPIRVEILA
jgi:hypothetical protein